MQFVVVFLLLFGFIPSSFSAPHREGLPLLNPGGIGGIFEGPDSETIIRGPDGSEITSEQKGGAVIRDDSLEAKPIIVAEPELKYTAPILTEERVDLPGPIISSTAAPILASAAPVIASAAPILASSATPLLTGETYEEPQPNYITAYAPEVPPAPLVSSEIYDAKPIEIVQQDPHIIETEIIEAPDVEPDQSSDLKGPSGRIITKGSSSIVSGPASTTITEPQKIIVAPPKIAIGTPVIATATIPLKQVPIAAPLPSISYESSSLAPLPSISYEASSLAPLPAASYGASSTYAPSILSYSSSATPTEYRGSSTIAPSVATYSTTAAPVEYGYSTTATPLVGNLESTKINLGATDLRQSIPVIEYSSSNGVINEPFLTGRTFSSTEAPILSSTISSITTDKYAPSEGPAVPAAYLTAPAAPQSAPAASQSFVEVSQTPAAASQYLVELPRAEGLVSSTASSYVQKIPRLEDNVAVDGRVDMGNPRRAGSKYYQFPQVLGDALTRFYRKTSTKSTKATIPTKPTKESIKIDDKMGELSQNEITSYDTRQQFLSPPNLSQSKYIAPALERNGIDASKVNFAEVPLSQVKRLPYGAYQSAAEYGYSPNRFEREAKGTRRNN